MFIENILYSRQLVNTSAQIFKKNGNDKMKEVLKEQQRSHR